MRTTLQTIPAFAAAMILALLATNEASADTPVAGATLARAPESGGSIPAVASADPSTGIAHASIPFSLPKARGLHQPALSLDYAAGATRGEGGWGWSLSGVPRIERRGASGGMPKYQDGNPSDPMADRYYYNGTRLTAIGVIANGTCAGALPGEQFPLWAEGTTYYRPMVGDGDLRLFFGNSAWRAELKSGVTMFFGSAETYAGAVLNVGSSATTSQSRWFLTVATDTWGNAVGYKYRSINSLLGTRLLLSDIYDTPPAGQPNADTSAWAHHTRLIWSDAYPDESDPSPDNNLNGTFTERGVLHNLLLGVDVASKTFTGTGARAMLRRYHLRYSVDPTAHATGPSPLIPFLKGASLEGTCGGFVEDATESLPATTKCQTTPETQYTYSGESGAPKDPLRISASGVPAETAFLDLTGDGLPDTLDKGGLLNNTQQTHWEARPQPQGGRISALGDVFDANPTNGIASIPTFGDFNGDGQPNVLIWRQNPSLSYEVYSLSTSKQWVGQGPFPLTPGSWFDNAVSVARSQSLDVDGDGYTDVALVPAGVGGHSTSILTIRDAQGRVTPFQRSTEKSSTGFAGTCGPNITSAVRWGFGDFDGDGLSDFVSFETDLPGGSTFRFIHARISRNLGNGQFGLWTDNGQNACVTRGAQQVLNLTSDNLDSDSLFGVHDVTGDGVADVVRVSSGGLDVFARDASAGGFSHIQHIDAATIFGSTFSPASFTSAKVALRFADVNRSGVDDILFTSAIPNLTNPKNATYFSGTYDVMGGVRPGFLTNVSQNGASTSFTYKVIPAFEPKIDADWSKAVPQVLSVVDTITTTNGLPAPQAQTIATTYTYESPVYDVHERLFEGFRVATVQTAADASAPGTTVRTEFATNAPAIYPGNPWPPSANYSYPIVRGLPLVTETTERPTTGTGVRLMTQSQSYDVIPSYTGLDGAHTFIVRQKRADTYIFGQSHQATKTLAVAAFAAASGAPSDVLALNQNVNATVPLTYGKHLRVESTIDAFGNVTSETEFGEDGVDDPIQTRTAWTEPEVAHEAQHGYLYRPSHFETSYMTKDGASVVGPVRSASYAWGRNGELQTTTATLTGTLALDRSPLRGVPPLPTEASVQGTHDVVLEQAFYDAYGNIRGVIKPNSRCSKTDYDTPFAELPVGTTVYPSGCTSDPSVNPPSGGFTLGRGYDRGFQKVTSTIATSGRMTATVYDPFGRPLSVYGPSATSLYQHSVQPTAYFTYRDSNIGGPSYVIADVADGKDEANASYHETIDYYDSFGHQVAHESEGGPLGWVVSGYNERSSNGRVVRTYEPYDAAGPVGISFVFATPKAKAWTATYDGMGRVVATTDLEGNAASSNVYRPFETDHYDGEELAGGDHVGAYTSTRVDGHGRVVAVTRFLNAPASTTTTSMTYLATGETTSRTETTAGQTVVRWMQYDSFGRMVLNVHPDTSVGFTSTVGTVGSAPPAGLKAWRYVYNDSGDVVGTSDPRGCGRNVFYDRLGRLTAEDYWPCTAAQPDYTAPNLTTGDGTEHFIRYDTADPGHNAGPSEGVATTESDRGQRTFLTYDPRGRVASMDRQIARPIGLGPVVAVLANRYTPHVYTKTFAFDDGNRVTSESTGADVDALLVNGQSVLTSGYSNRGTLDIVGGSYGTLVNQLTYAPDGSVMSQRWGDAAHTQSAFAYDAEHRLQTVSIKRGPNAPWLPASASYIVPPATSRTTFESDLTEQTLTYDRVGNPKTVAEGTDPTLWPDGAKPVVSRAFTYDDAYRLTAATYVYGGANGSPDDSFVSPYDAEAKASSTRFPQPVLFGTRVRSQNFGYDALGSLNATDDNLHAVGDRSMGTMTNGGAAGGPHRLETAANGQISTTYDEAGNLTNWTRQVCNPRGIVLTCVVVSYVYTWDETNHLASARRAEGSNFATSTAVQIDYGYSAGGGRVYAHKVGSTGPEGYDVDVFPSLRLQGTTYSGDPAQVGDFDRSPSTERVYLATGGLSLGVVAFAQTDFDTSGKRRVFFELGDHLGSTNFVIDQETSELVERPTYQAYGAAETDFRPDRWKNFRETFRFNGKIDDAEVGLAYYGARYLVPLLGRWASPDPLEIHAMGSDPNPYAFASGSPTARVDWSGLDATCDKCGDDAWSFGGFIAGVGSSIGNWFGGGGGGGGTTAKGSAPSAAPPPPPPPPPPIPPQVSTPTPAPVPAPEPPSEAYLARVRHQEAIGRIDLGDLLEFGRGLIQRSAPAEDSSGAGAHEMGRQLGQNLAVEGAGVVTAVLRAVPRALATVRWMKIPVFLPTGTGGGGILWLGKGAESTAARVAELTEAIPAAQKGRITMAVGVAEDANGVESTLVSTSEPGGYLRPGVTLKAGETLVRGTGHAEMDIANYTYDNRLFLKEIGATRPVCQACASGLPWGTIVVTPFKANVF